MNIGVIVIVVAVVLFVILVLPKLLNKDNLTFTEKILLSLSKKEGFEYTQLPSKFYDGFSSETINLFNSGLSTLLSKACNIIIKSEDIENKYLKYLNYIPAGTSIDGENKVNHILNVLEFYSAQSLKIIDLNDTKNKDVLDIVCGIFFSIWNSNLSEHFDISYNSNAKLVTFNIKDPTFGREIFGMLNATMINDVKYEVNLDVMNNALINILKRAKLENQLTYGPPGHHNDYDNLNICS